ncbi:MAG: lipid-A-disaccharide synthase [Gemmatimonadales bacterium]|nr:lipid-A-disaccharide synthase [Gemmatimonadales bacterium]
MDPNSIRHIFLSCGEASGDRYGAELISALRRIDPSLRISCLGARNMAGAGAEVVLDSSELAIMGFAEVLGALPAVIRARRKIFSFLGEEKVDLVVPIDFPGFNGGVASRAKSLGVPVFWLIAPQVWAWGGWRIRGLREKIDRLGTILPFEPKFFTDHGFDVFDMGHPLMENFGGDFPFEEGITRRERKFHDQDGPLKICLLPGSRKQELSHLLPILKVTSQALVGHLGERPAHFVVSAAPGVDPKTIRSVFNRDTEISSEPLERVLAGSDLALVCSGTASLEAALAGVPHEIVYRTGKLNYWLARHLVRTQFIGLSNLILDKPIIREHIQEGASPLPLARELLRWVTRPNERMNFYQQARDLRNLCGSTGVWERTASALLEFLDETSNAPS